MRIKVDENLHDEVAAFLCSEGHDAQTVHEQGHRGIDDTSLLEHCRADGRVIVTMDLDFADIRVYPPSSHAGIIVLRLRDQGRTHVRNVVSMVAALLTREPISGRLWIVSEGGVRIRGG